MAFNRYRQIWLGRSIRIDALDKISSRLIILSKSQYRIANKANMAKANGLDEVFCVALT